MLCTASQYTTLKGRQRHVMNHFAIRHIEDGLCLIVFAKSKTKHVCKI